HSTGRHLFPFKRESGVVDAGLIVDDDAAAGGHVFGNDFERRQRVVLECLVERTEKGIAFALLAEPAARVFGVDQVVPEAEAFLGASELHGARSVAAGLATDFAGDELEIERRGQALVGIRLRRDRLLKGFHAVGEYEIVIDDAKAGKRLTKLWAAFALAARHRGILSRPIFNRAVVLALQAAG